MAHCCNGALNNTDALVKDVTLRQAVGRKDRHDIHDVNSLYAVQ